MKHHAKAADMSLAALADKGAPHWERALLEETKERIAAAIRTVLSVSRLPAKSQIEILRDVGEAIPTGDIDEDTAFEQVRLRSLGAEDELRKLEGGGLPDAAFAKRAGISRETVRKYREKGKLIAWQKDSRNLRYPAWQAHQGGLLPGLAAVLEVLAPHQMTPLALVDYFLSESEELDGARPLDLLRENRTAEVVAHAGRYGVAGT